MFQIEIWISDSGIFYEPQIWFCIACDLPPLPNFLPFSNCSKIDLGYRYTL